MTRRVTISAAVCLMTMAGAQAADQGSREEAVAMVHAVQEFAARDGLAAVFDAVTKTDRFKDRDLYPFIYRVDGLSVAHGANPNMVGKSWIGTRDQDGNFLIQRMVAVAAGPGRGWVAYKWPDPLTHKILSKEAYIEKLGDEYFVGVGVYER